MERKEERSSTERKDIGRSKRLRVKAEATINQLHIETLVVESQRIYTSISLARF